MPTLYGSVSPKYLCLGLTFSMSLAANVRHQTPCPFLNGPNLSTQR